MNRLLLTFILIVAGAALSAAQNYTLHSTTPAVKVVSAGKTADAKKGMKVKGTDVLVIPDGGVVEVYNEFDKRIYRSLRPGKVSVTKLLIEARQVAADNSKNVGNRLNLGKNGSGGKQAYAEKGMVTREFCEADTTASTCVCDSLPTD